MLKIRLVMVIAIILVMAGCGKNPVAPGVETLGTISGEVIDPNSQKAIAGAEVRILPTYVDGGDTFGIVRYDTTDADGRFNLTGRFKPDKKDDPLSGQLTVTVAGYPQFKEWVEFPPKQTAIEFVVWLKSASSQ